MFKPVDAAPDFPALEEEVLAFWEREQIFAKTLAASEGKPRYVTYDGPPTANGKPALHHLVPSAFKDAAARFATQRGYFVPRQAGWDTHGLPVEVQVEKAMGLAGKQDVLKIVPGDEAASVSAFNKACRDSVWTFKQDWEAFVRRAGRWLDMENPYITYDPGYIEGVWGVLKQIWDKGLVFKDYKVVPYCPRCGTGLSAAEVAQEYQDVKDVSVFVTFPWADKPGRSFIAWTTTPWTLPGHVALALGEDIQYVVVRQEDREYVLAKERLEILTGEYVIVEEVLGKDLVGIRYEPLFPGVMDDADGERFVTVLADFVTTTDGSGIVHTACMYGEDDFNLGKAAGLTMKHSVDLEGNFMPHVAEFAGMNVREALVPILRSLSEKGRLYKKQTITHSYPHCWRCKTPLIYYAKDSWYVGMSQLRSELVAANATVEWVPEHIKDGRFGDFIREARDWAISRERFWGTPLPIWKSESGKFLCVGSVTELRELAKDPAVIPADFDPHRPQIDAIVLHKDGEDYYREPYVMDVWFDSGAMPFASGAFERGEFPADVIAEAIDQTRGWFYSLLAISVILTGKAPYKRVICMGHLVDEHGRKMSKSVGNVIEPMEAFATLSADAVRWFIFTVNAPGETKAVSSKEVQVAFRRTLLPLWNVFNYFVTYANLAGWERGQSGELTELDRWIMSRRAALIDDVTRYFEASDFTRGGRVIEDFVQELSTWYLRRSRKRTDAAFFATLYETLLAAVKLIAPLAPFLAETMYRTLRSENDAISVHAAAWPASEEVRDTSLEDDMRTVLRIVELGQAARAKAKIKVRQPLAGITVTHPSLSAQLSRMILDELNVQGISYGRQEAEYAQSAMAEGVNGERVWLDTLITPELQQEGDARELMRQLQQKRKTDGLQPGQWAVLRFGPDHRDYLEPLLNDHPFILETSFLRLDDDTWTKLGQDELTVNGRTINVSFL